MEFRVNATLEERIKSSNETSDLNTSTKESPRFTANYDLIVMDYIPKEYVRNMIRVSRDTTKFVRGKVALPSNTSEMGVNLLGYTQQLANWKVLSPILFGRKLEKVGLHEDIHTDREYETRILEEWMHDEIGLLPYEEQNAARFMYGNRKHMDN